MNILKSLFRRNPDKALAKGRCPDCGGTELRGGPQGGISMNFLCASCLSEFNVALFDPPRLLNHLGKASAHRAALYGLTIPGADVPGSAPASGAAETA